ncbi:hypothetical protein ACI1TM_08655 [Lactococcus garvieae]|uniref:hypothetical protein n=1 Tax=Lactococcus garvieae TaxID=1363 RepID=UPI0038548F46
MDVLIKLIGVVGGVFAVRGLFSVLTGAMDFFAGRKNDNPNKVDSGIEAMTSGGLMAGISGGVTAAIIVAIQAIKF